MWAAGVGGPKAILNREEGRRHVEAYGDDAAYYTLLKTLCDRAASIGLIRHGGGSSPTRATFLPGIFKLLPHPLPQFLFFRC